jgi:hypothetical protein
VVQACIGLAMPGRLIRSLVAENRSAEGVRDQTGPEPNGPRWVRGALGVGGHERSPAASGTRRQLTYGSYTWDDSSRRFGLWARQSGSVRRAADGQQPTAVGTNTTIGES